MFDRKPGQAESVDAIYDDPSLVPLYDILNSADHDREFYRAEFPPGTKHVVDLGCGTGRFAIDLAQRGYQVTAVDPAPAMIAYARTQDKDAKVDWILGTAAQIPANKKADAVVMMGHAFQCLLTDDAALETLTHIRSVLCDGGRFLFESRNPAVAPWSRWGGRIQLPRDGSAAPLSVERRVLATDGEFVTFEEVFFLTDGPRTSRSTLRFPSKNTVTRQLRATGFDDIEIFGFWDRRPFAEDSPEMIFSAR